jgi:hypothetical protein
MSLSVFTDNRVATNKVADEIEHTLAFLGSIPCAERHAGLGAKQIFIPDRLACQKPTTARGKPCRVGSPVLSTLATVLCGPMLRFTFL